jgi:hypothetical protein
MLAPGKGLSIGGTKNNPADNADSKLSVNPNFVSPPKLLIPIQ